MVLPKEDGEVDEHEDAEAEGEGVCLEVAVLGFAEEVPGRFGEAAEATYEDAVD